MTIKQAHPVNYQNFKINFDDLFNTNIITDLRNSPIPTICADQRTAGIYDRIQSNSFLPANLTLINYYLLFKRNISSLGQARHGA